LTGLFSHPKRKLKKLVKEGEYKEAVELGKSLEKKNPNDFDLLFIMGSIFYILKDAKGALHYFDKVISINEFDTEALLLKANVHDSLKEFKTAADCCRRILKIDSENKEAQKLLEKIENELG